MRRSLASRSAAIAGMAECGGHRGKRTDEEKRIANKLAQEMCRARKKQGLPPVKKGRKRKAESTQLFGSHSHATKQHRVHDYGLLQNSQHAGGWGYITAEALAAVAGPSHLYTDPPDLFFDGLEEEGSEKLRQADRLAAAKREAERFKTQGEAERLAAAEREAERLETQRERLAAAKHEAERFRVESEDEDYDTSTSKVWGYIKGIMLGLLISSVCAFFLYSFLFFDVSEKVFVGVCGKPPVCEKCEVCKKPPVCEKCEVCEDQEKVSTLLKRMSEDSLGTK